VAELLSRKEKFSLDQKLITTLVRIIKQYAVAFYFLTLKMIMFFEFLFHLLYDLISCFQFIENVFF